LLHISDEYLNLTRRSTEILVPKQEYRNSGAFPGFPKSFSGLSEKPGNIMSAAPYGWDQIPMNSDVGDIHLPESLYGPCG